MLLLPQHPTHLYFLPPSRRESKRKSWELKQKKKIFHLFYVFLVADGISELVGTMFTVKYFAQASLPLLPPALPHIFAENMFNLTGVNR